MRKFMPALILTLSLSACVGRVDAVSAARFAEAVRLAHTHVEFRASASYVKFSEAGYMVEKPFPKIFFADENFPTDGLIREFVIFVKTQDIQSAIVDASAYCSNYNILMQGDDFDQEEEAIEKYNTEGMMVTYKSANENPVSCFIPKPEHCEGMRKITSSFFHQYALKDDENFSELLDRVDCK